MLVYIRKFSSRYVLNIDKKNEGSGNKMKKASKIFSWVLTIFMILAALVYMPSVASVFMVIFAAIAIPIYRVQEFWAAKRLSGFIKTIALLVLFLVSISLAPTDRYRHDSEEESQNPASNEELEL